MDCPFKRSLPQVMLTAELESGVPSSKHEQFLNRIQERLDCYERRLTTTEGNNNDLVEKLAKCKTLEQEVSKELSEEVEKNKKIKTKINNLEINIKSLKSKLQEVKEHSSKLQNNIIKHEQEVAEKKEKLIAVHHYYLTFYNLYKKYFCCKIEFESSNVIRFEFSQDFYVKLHSDDWKSNWKLKDIKPELKNQDEIEKKLYETDDIQAFLVCMYKSFQVYLKSKNCLQNKENLAIIKNSNTG